MKKHQAVLWVLVVLLLLTGLLYALRTPLLTLAAKALIHTHPLQTADAIFMLSGGGYDRGNEAALLYNKNLAPIIVCTGANPFVELKVFGIDTLENDMGVANLKRLGVPPAAITQLRHGTSTREEMDTITAYCRQKGWKRVIVLTSLLHTGRVNRVFAGPMKQAGVTLIVHGAPSSRFSEYRWWQTEDGLIAVNNEWLKTLYYLLKY